jgi:predicted class III extradiol MEMO1 family dioxygenase
MVRLPVVAGSFYEGHEAILVQRLENCFLGELGPGRLPEGEIGTSRSIKALIAPHAGYMYSGMPAAHSYLRLFEDGRPDHIVIFGPNHTGIGDRLAVCAEDWQTPLGVVRYDTELGPAIVDENSFATVQSYQACESIGKTVAKLADEMDILVIASTDFTHFESADSAQKKDNQAIEYLEYMDPEGFLGFVKKHRLSICGAGPVAAAMVFAKERGALSFRLIKYTNSGDITGDKSSVVAYVAAEIM